MTKEDVENWFDTLGACTGKGEISVNKEKLTAYLMQTKGFTTGEDFVLSISKDIEEAKWQRFEVDLTKHAGKPVSIELWNQATGWSHEAAYWSRIDFVYSPLK